jgi:hypothetical protein
MNLSKNFYVADVNVGDNPENLDSIQTVISNLNKIDVNSYFAGLSINEDSLYFLPSMAGGVLTSRKILKSGYQSLLSKINIPFRLVENKPSWIEIPLVNGRLIQLAQKSYNSDILIRMIGGEIRAILSSSYTTIDDKDIIDLLEKSFLPQINNIHFTCDHTKSLTNIITRNQGTWEYNGYTVSMFLYISNSEIGDASVKCGIGITIAKNERQLSFNFSRDIRTLGKVIHRGDSLKKLEKELSNLFNTVATNWSLIQNALITMSNVNVQDIPSIEERMVKALKSMPEFEIWKTQYDSMRESSVINNMFDLIYVMTSIPYRDENFATVVEEILFGRFF